MEKYNPQKIEKEWQKIWEKSKTNFCDLNKAKNKFYNLVMFFYPSGDKIHIGHGYNYTGSDVFGRYKRMQGYNVFQPMGYDAFGLPAENYAIKAGVHPAVSTQKNIEFGKRQLKELGLMYDWEKEVDTSSVKYYKWTQWLFSVLYKAGLAYRKQAPVNWCPSCKTVLANEQVISGKCERCDSEVIQKNLKQWFFKITDYADRLLEDHSKIDWPQKTITMQKNWIGKSEGADVDFVIEAEQGLVNPPINWWVNQSDGDRFFFVTFPTYKRTCSFDFEDEAQKIVKIFDKIIRDKKYQVIDLVVMLEHIHLVVNRRKNEDLEKIVKNLKGISSRVYNYKEGHLWAKSFEYEEIKDGKSFNNFLNYLKKNPEKDGLKDEKRLLSKLKPYLKVFTTRPDTLFGATFMVLAPEHELINKLKSKISNFAEIGKYIEKAKKKSDLERTDLAKEKTGVELKGIKAINPVNNKEIPVWVADYVIMGYGTGAIMAVPAHDERDWEFAKKYNLEILQVIKGGDIKKQAFTEIDSGEMINSGEFNGMQPDECIKKIIKWLEKEKIGKQAITYRLRDWLISRQRYWGAPIPIIYCNKCGEILDENLPVELPKLDNFKPTNDGESPLARSEKFVNVKCPKCGDNAKRCTETMDTFVCSSWYYLRYLNPDLDNKAFDEKVMKKWLPVDQYCGGAEHAVMHLMYARFITKVLYDQKLINFDEPFLKLNHQGMILAEDGSKMSKSKDNVVIPDDYVKKFGADVFRMYVLFLAPFEDGGAWSDKGIIGVKRFFDRIIMLLYEDFIGMFGDEKERQSWFARSSIDSHKDVRVELNKTIKKITEDIEEFKFNTAISQMMILLNFFYTFKNDEDVIPEKGKWISPNDFEKFLILLAPFAPYFAEEIWHRLDEKGRKDKSIFNEKWPEYDKKLIVEDEIELVVQINGKVRDKIKASANISENEAKKLALESEKVQKWLENKKPKKIIFIKGKLVSIVI